MLTYSDITREIIKCMADRSRIYMIENYLSTYDLSKRKQVPFKLFPRQKDFVKALATYSENITTKPRQAGITTTAAAYISCEIALADRKSPETVLIVGNKLDLSQQLLTKIKQFLLQFPRWFWGDEYYSPDKKSEKNKRDIFELKNKNELLLFNGCRVKAISSGESAARGVSSVSWLIFDEAAFIENGREVYAQAIATTATGGHTIMISTPHGKDLLYYDTYNKSRIGQNNFHVTELKWFQDPRYNKELKWWKKNKETGEYDWIIEETIDDEGNIPYDEERWAKLEREGWKPTSLWYRNMCAKFNQDEQKIAQELDVSFLGSSNNVVDPEYIEMQQTLNVREPDPNLKDPFFEETWIWKAPIEGHRYLMSIDCSRGDAADRTAIEIIDMDGRDENGQPILEQVLEYHGKQTGDVIGEVAYNYGTMYGNAFTVVDCIGGTGDACILTLMNLGYKNLYYDDASLKTYTIQRTYSKLAKTEEDKLPGFHSGSVRFQMLTNFANLVKTNQIKIRSKRVISELETWVYQEKTGRIDHMDGCHDDTLTCLAMGLFVMQFSLSKLEATKTKDIAILKSYMIGGGIPINKPFRESVSITPKSGLPFYNRKTLPQTTSNVHGTCLWLFAGNMK